MSTDNERIAELEARTRKGHVTGDRHAYYREDIEFLLALLKRKSAALEEACEAIRFVAASWNNGLLEISAQDETSHEIVERSLDNIKGLLARIESLEHGKTNDA